MKTIVVTALMLAAFSVSAASARPFHHPHRVCQMNHHHRVCYMR